LLALRFNFSCERNLYRGCALQMWISSVFAGE
jgi:hypothetical protein